jgi:hypothetical protein
MRGLLATLVMLLGGLAVTGLLASGLQEKATAGHRVDEDFLPGGEAAIDRWGWRQEPKAVRSDAGRADTGQADTGRVDTDAEKARRRLNPDWFDGGS